MGSISGIKLKNNRWQNRNNPPRPNLHVYTISYSDSRHQESNYVAHDTAPLTLYQLDINALY